MIQSMTGYGRAEGQIGDRKVSVQIRSLNSKQADINLKLPSAYRVKELDIRSIISSELHRGKIELLLSYENQDVASKPSIDQALFKSYFEQLNTIAKELNHEADNLIGQIARFPEVIKVQETELSSKDLNDSLTVIKEALKAIISFRKAEGVSLEEELNLRINNIEKLLDEALQYEHSRIEIVKERIKNHLNELSLKSEVNQDRFEQEMIYYLEKYDISEEKVRLRTHCNYFKECMQEEEPQGKKLGFISQEIGREINTLGSKANHAEMQQCVVRMKDELEKIKEQVLNIL